MKLTTKLLVILLLLVLLPLITSAQGNSRWLQIGPSAGTIQQITPHRGIPNVVFVINNRHLYRSTDSGKHWQLKPLENVLDVQIHFKTGVIFVLTEIPKPRYDPSSSALYFSVDGGKNFKLLSQPNIPLENIRIHPDNPDVMFSWGYELYKSLDGGRHWEIITSFPDNKYGEVEYIIADVLFSPTDPESVFVSASAYVDHGAYDAVILESATLERSGNLYCERTVVRILSIMIHPCPAERWPTAIVVYSVSLRRGGSL